MLYLLQFHEANKMRVALTIWNGHISPVFDVSRTLLILEVEDGAILDEWTEALPESEASAKISKLAELEVKTLICGAISHPLQGMAAARSIQLIPFVAGEVQKVKEAFLSGALPSPLFLMPGCRGGGKKYRRGRGQGCRRNRQKGRKQQKGDNYATW